MRPLKAIRLNCLDCCCGSAKEVKLCVIPQCPLYEFRFGKNPNRKGIGNTTGNQILCSKTSREIGGK